MSDISVLIYSCDAYSDIWGPFFTLFFRYWDCSYPVYVTAETEQCLLPDVKTINTQGTWTQRIRQAVEQIPTEYIIGMCEDMFFRRPVIQETISACKAFMDNNPNIGAFNFEKEYVMHDESQYPSFVLKASGSEYKKTCQPTLWRRSVLLELLDMDCDAWAWEDSATDSPYEFYVWTGPEQNLVFEYGYHNRKWFGIHDGKWVADDVGPLFEKENIKIDLSVRGTM